MATQIFVKNNAGATLYTIDCEDPPVPPVLYNSYNSASETARVTVVLNNRDNPGTPWYAVDSAGRSVYAKVCPECGSSLP
jgi:hypothetical protein